ncbi:MAG: class I SAM-dependent methyltransferase [candidate division KSB1 bacterium]|nr:class I SAM-dependent methyltransferase [candidate division KSB1 bacterium]
MQLLPSLPGLHLDLASGTGDTLDTLPLAAKRIFLDAQFPMLSRLPQSCRVAARVEALPFSAQTFACISAIGLLEYLEREDQFFFEVARVLQTTGYFIFTSSPPNFGNRLRGLLGEPLYLRPPLQVKALLQLHGWRILGHTRSWLQDQWLVTRSS